MKVAVTGAGPAGLAFLKELKETGSDAVCFEATTHHVGGVFGRSSLPPQLHVVSGGSWPKSPGTLAGRFLWLGGNADVRAVHR